MRCTYQKEGLLCGLYSLVGLDALRDSVISSLQIRYEGTQPVALLKPRGACFRYASFQKKMGCFLMHDRIGSSIAGFANLKNKKTKKKKATGTTQTDSI